MANPRQRRKARSSAHRPVSHAKHAKRNLQKTPPIRAPKLLQQAWDKHKTVRQNYAALGLIHDLNPTESGGTEIIKVDERNIGSESIDSTDSLTSQSKGHTITSTSSTAEKPAIPKGHGRIIRDEDGNILHVELPEDEREEASTAAVDGDVDMEQLEPELDANIRDQWVSDLGGANSRLASRNNSIVKGLETLSTLPPSSVLQNQQTLSASLTGVGSRHTSERERVYLQRLVERYQNDVDAMARDRKLNSMQRTAGELRRALKRAGLVPSFSEVEEL